MAEHRAARGASRLQLEKIGAAEADDAEPKQHLARPGFGNRPALQLRPLAAEAGDDIVARSRCSDGLPASRMSAPSQRCCGMMRSITARSSADTTNVRCVTIRRIIFSVVTES